MWSAIRCSPTQYELVYASVYQGEYLYIERPKSGKPVFLQVEFNPLRRPISNYDEKLVRDGVIRPDDERIVGKASCQQIGFEECREIQPVFITT